MGKGCLFWFLPTKSQDKKGLGGKKNAGKNVSENKIAYKKVKCLITDSEKKFFEVIKTIIQDKYIIQPQVNLATVVKKESEDFSRQNELYRNIDFGVFTKNYEPLMLIEINDSTHNTQKRQERDSKVKTICSQAEIPLVTFWTSYGANQSYIREQLNKYLEL